jgi:Asp-tRNA(Asn)/Glu-tRNA(Gln) amidotransferase B subunit
VTSEGLGELIDLVNEGKISIRTGKEVLALMVEEKEEENVKGKSPSTIVAERGWEQMSDETQLRALATKLVADPASARQLRQYKQGKLQMLKYFVGQAMKETGGRAAPELMEAFLKEELGK